MKVLVGCEVSGRVRDAFRDLGHEAVSCDLEPTLVPGPHLQCNLLEVLDVGWDMLVAHPPCTYLASSGLHWNRYDKHRDAKTTAAVTFVARLLAAPIPRIAIENPVGCLSTRLYPPTQTIQPWMFGEDASKATCLWLIGVPPLRPTQLRLPDRQVALNPRWSNQTDDGHDPLPDNLERSIIRSITYKGIALAMANQWGSAHETTS